MTGGIGDSSGKVLTLDDLIEAMDKRERTPRSVPKFDTFHFNGERVSEWLDLVEQALVGVPDETKFKRILQYVLHKHHPEVQKVVDDANGDWAKFKEGMQRKYRLGDGLLTMADLEAMNRDGFTTIGAFLQEFKKKARKVYGISEEAHCAVFLGLLTASETVELTSHGGGNAKLTWATIDRGVEVGGLDQVEQHQVRLQRQKRKDRDVAGLPGVKKIITDILAGPDPVIQRKVTAAVQKKGKGAVVEEATQEGWEEEELVPPHLTKAQRNQRNLAQGGQGSGKGHAPQVVVATSPSSSGPSSSAGPSQAPVPPFGHWLWPLVNTYVPWGGPTPSGQVIPYVRPQTTCGNYEVITCRNTGPRSLRNRPNPGSFTIEESEDAHRRLMAEPEEEVEGEAFSLSLSDVGKAMDIVTTHEMADPDAIQALREQVLEYPHVRDMELVYRLPEGRMDPAQLRKLVRQDQEWTWGEDQEEAVANMKEEFREGGLVVQAPDYDTTETRPFIVETDAGPTALGGVLIQVDVKGKERPLRFESRTLCTRFILRVDPTALAFSLRNYVSSDPTVARWLTYIWMFNFVLERIPGNKNRADGLSRINWDRQDGEAVEDTLPVDGFLDQDEDIRRHINKWSPRVPSCVGHPIWHAPKGYERKAELVLKPFEEEDPWGGKDVQWMTKLALAGSPCMVDEVLTIEEGPDKVKHHEELMGGMYLLVNALLQESLDLESSLNPAEGRDTVLESQDDEFEEGEIKEAFRAEEYDGIYLELGLLLSCEMRDRDASHRAQMMRDHYLVRDGHLFVRREVGNPRRVVCGRNRQIDVIAVLHDGIAGGHQGITATKLDKRWLGPYRIVRCREFGAYQIEELNGAKWKDWVSGTRFKKFVAREEMEELRTSPVGPDGRPIRLEIGNAEEFIPAFEQFMQNQGILRSEWMTTLPLWTRKAERHLAKQIRDMTRDWDGCRAHLRVAFRQPEPPQPRVERRLRSGRQREPEPAEDRTSRRGRKALARQEKEGVPEAERKEEHPEGGLGPVEFHRYIGGGLGEPPQHIQDEIPIVEGSLQELEAHLDAAQWREPPMSEGRIEAITEVPQENVPNPKQEEGPSATKDRIGDEIIEVEEDTPPQGPAVGLRLGSPLESPPDTRKKVQREEVSISVPETALSPTGMEASEAEGASLRREADSLIDSHLATHALEQPSLEEVIPVESPWEPGQTEREVETGVPGEVEQRTVEEVPAKETAEEKRARVARRWEEIRQEGQRLEAAGVLPSPPPPCKPYGLREMWGEFLARHGEGLTAPGKAEAETSRKADEYLDMRIRSVFKASFDRPGGQSQPRHGVSEQPAVDEPQQEAPMGRVILEPEEAEAKRKAEREAFEFRAPTELAVLPTIAADPAMPPLLEERLPSASDEPSQGSTGGSLDVLLEAVHSMQEDAGLFSPESKLEESLESEMGGAMEGIIAGRPQRLDTPDYEPEGARAQPGPSPRESESGSEKPRDVPQCHELDGGAMETPSPAGAHRKKKKPRTFFDSACLYCTEEEHRALQCLKFLKDQADGKVSEYDGKMYDRQGRVVERAVDGGRAQLYRQNQEEMSEQGLVHLNKNRVFL
ncbi:hypothetical protein CBR_g45772 [Chara braunii]|uniref:Reverse transcriptase/retrotransposon-derived protein RNase H-like domain-containing protein n=1 Tax=Chara braunii TaxID=69332 RepID=A0A388LZ65_CHABU|nr:hypothetical protein CBR_g45772 [Chara braunii]|eukprot:GBG87620.1 hypothetical protein CBR_g45772 [Chara braunii]